MRFIGWKIRAKNPARTEIWKLVEGGNHCCQRSDGSYQYGACIFPVDLEELPESRERTGAPVLSMSGSYFSDSSSLSAILDRQGLLVAAPVDLRRKKAESFFATAVARLLFKLKKKKPKNVVMSPTLATKSHKQREVLWQQYHLCLAAAAHHILGGKHFLISGGTASNLSRKALPYFGTWVRKDSVVEKYSTSKTSTTANGPSHVQGNPSGFFHNFGNLLCPLELVPASREHVVPIFL